MLNFRRLLTQKFNIIIYRLTILPDVFGFV